MPRHQFTREDAQRGGKARKHRAAERSPDFVRGYQAGWIAGKRRRVSRRRSSVITLACSTEAETPDRRVSPGGDRP